MLLFKTLETTLPGTHTLDQYKVSLNMSLFSLSFITGVEPLPYIPHIPQTPEMETSFAEYGTWKRYDKFYVSCLLSVSAPLPGS